MKFSRSFFLLLLTCVLVTYYLVAGIYLHNLGYYNQESLFYIEKSLIVFHGVGARLKVMGLTSPMLPFMATFIFSNFDTLAPVLASAIGTAMLFYLIAATLIKRVEDDFFLYLLLAIFLFHPGFLYVACSGKSIYLVLIFFFLFFLNLLNYYRSNTTFHVSIASICLVILIFCDYKFVWLTLFFLPLVLIITINSLNLGEQESIFRLFLSFNSPGLRRKLINKTFSLYIILFALPLVAVLVYKLLNLTHARDLNYFNESPYATWNVLVDKLSFDQQATTFNYQIPEISLLLSVSVVIFCPMILIAIYLFRESTYQVLTILTPFAFIEFLHLKYDKVYLAYEYCLIFVVLSFLCVMFKLRTVKMQKPFRILMALTVLLQLYTGWYYLKTSPLVEERNFLTILTDRTPDLTQADNADVANYLNSLPDEATVLLDDATAYPVVAFVSPNNFRKLIMPYQDKFLGALESPDKNADYIMIATAKNLVAGYTQLNNRYLSILKHTLPQMLLHKVYETENWIIYRVVK